MSFWSNRALVRIAQNIVATLGDLLARSATAEESALADQLRSELRLLSEHNEDQLPFWQASTEALRRHAETEDPRYFMRWPPIAVTMAANTSPFAVAAYRALRRLPDWREKWRPAILQPNFGHGPPFLPNPRTNAITVQHATHLLRYQAATGRDLLDCNCITEFGGGFGSMCRLTTRLGRRGRYVIFDLPPILALQRYFLGLHGIAAGNNVDGRVVLTPSLHDVAAAMVPGTALMSTWALSEMPLSLRSEIEALLWHDDATDALIAYQHEFEGIDNVAYFTGLMHRTAELWTWQKIAIDAGSDYLFGTRT